MTLTELQTLHLEVQNLLETVRLAEVFNLAQDLPFCKGFEKYKNDFLNNHFPHNFDIFCQQLGLFLNQCFENEIEIKKLEQASVQNTTVSLFLKRRKHKNGLLPLSIPLTQKQKP